MRRRHLLQLTAGPVLAAVGDLAGSQPVQRRVLVAGTVFARLFEPVPGAAPTARPQGFAVDLLDAVLLPAGVTPTYELFPWLRAQAMIEQGSAQILVGPYRTREREARMRFSSQAFYEDAMVFYARAGQHDLWRDDFNALRTLQIGTVHGWVYGDRFEQARRHLAVTQVRDLPTALRMLQLGRLDLIAANQRNSEPVLGSWAWARPWWCASRRLRGFGGISPSAWSRTALSGRPWWTPACSACGPAANWRAWRRVGACRCRTEARARVPLQD